MKPTTAGDLQTILDTELVWRRKELTTLVTTIRSSDVAARQTLIRAAVPLLYAHWEGFGRACFQRYLEHVSYRSLRYKGLAPAFLYLTALGRIQEIARSSPKTAVPLIPEMLALRDKVNRNPFRNMIDTKSNLRFEVLLSLCAMCGLSSADFAEDASFIDHDICDPRNEIAHGAGACPSLEVFINRRDRAFGLMSKLQALVVNGAVEARYKAAS